MINIKNKFNHEKIDIGYKDLDAETTDSGRTYSTPDGKSYPSVTTGFKYIKRTYNSSMA